MNLGYTRPIWFDYLCIVAGTCLMGIGLQSIYDPVGMVVGGFTGIAILVKQLTEGQLPGGIPLWLTNMVLNIPVFIWGYLAKGAQFIRRTVCATFLLSFWLAVLPRWDIAQGDYVLAAIYGGAITGAGIGLVLMARATTGGTDMVATLLQRYLRRYSVVQIMLFLDGIIVLSGMAFFGIQMGLYAVLAIFITSEVSDALMEGIKYSKAVFIVTDAAEEVAQQVMNKMERGITGIHAKGMYSGEERDMLYCVVSKKEIVELKEIVMSIDRKAFVIVTDAREVLGEGFLEY